MHAWWKFLLVNPFTNLNGVFDWKSVWEMKIVVCLLCLYWNLQEISLISRWIVMSKSFMWYIVWSTWWCRVISQFFLVVLKMLFAAVMKKKLFKGFCKPRWYRHWFSYLAILVKVLKKKKKKDSNKWMFLLSPCLCLVIICNSQEFTIEPYLKWQIESSFLLRKISCGNRL